MPDNVPAAGTTPTGTTPTGTTPTGPLVAALADRRFSRRLNSFMRDFLRLRTDIPLWQTVAFALACIALCLGLWWFVTSGENDERIISPLVLPSPAATFADFPALWSDRYLTVNTVVTLKRVALGFGLAAVVGVPLGILCGCFPRLNAFFLPLTIFGRNIPIAALIPLTFALFAAGELQKVMFIFIACVAFVVSDAARSVAEVGTPYVDTAYTLGASRWQVIIKVLVPLALPSIFNSLRLLFGLAFGYIMLAEVVKLGAVGGLGDLIAMSERRGLREDIILILLIIPVLALLIDRALFWVQRELFPYRYGGAGILNQVVRTVLHAWDDLKCLVRRAPAPATLAPPSSERKQP
jgi:ABC-type nitrate/sulfonate/bicarbonate transport system permease component